MSHLLRYASFIALLFFGAGASSQVDFKNTKYNVRDTNVIFAGFENDFIVLNIPPKGIRIESKKCQIKNPGDTGNFQVLCRKEGVDTFYLIKNNRIIRSKIFHIKKFNDVHVQLGAIKMSTATKNEIIANRGLVFVNDCNCAFPLRVMSFLFRAISVRLPETLVRTDGNLLSARAIDAINRLESGDIIEFSKIISNCASGIQREFPPFRITIK